MSDDDAAKLKAFRDLNPGRHAVSRNKIEVHAGYIEMHLAGADWRIFYLPFLAPLPGARLDNYQTIPTAQQLLGMPYNSSMPPMFQSERSAAEERELKRIEKTVQDQKVVVTTPPPQ